MTPSCVPTAPLSASSAEDSFCRDVPSPDPVSAASLPKNASSDNSADAPEDESAELPDLLLFARCSAISVRIFEKTASGVSPRSRSPRTACRRYCFCSSITLLAEVSGRIFSPELPKTAFHSSSAVSDSDCSVPAASSEAEDRSAVPASDAKIRTAQSGVPKQRHAASTNVDKIIR